MTGDHSDDSNDLDILDQFLAAYANSPDREVTLTQWQQDHAHLNDELRLLATFETLTALRVPREIGGVELFGLIGRGGMGLVYEGVERSVGRSVAVKLCPAVGDPGGRDRFLRECRTLGELHQTSIVPILSAGREGLWLYCVMPLIDGESLAELTRRARSTGTGPLPPLPTLIVQTDSSSAENAIPNPGKEYLRSVVEVIVLAAEAVGYAHQRGVWHLDIKPANLMLEEAGHCWVIDFGVSRNTSLDPLHHTGLTMAYAAPEQWVGEGDARSDVWGLGATLYELLVLTRPFPDERMQADTAHGPRWTPKPLLALCPDVPRDLNAICLKALAEQPDERYQTVAAFEADLRRWLNGEEPVARPWSLLARARAFAHRHQAWAVASVACIVGMVTTLLLIARGEYLDARRTAAEAEAVAARANLQREADAHTQARVWNLLEQARDRLTNPTAGRRADVRRLLLAAAREQQSISDPVAAGTLATAVRSRYVESLGLLDAKNSVPKTTHMLPASAFHDWPIDIHPDGKSLAIGTTRRPILWRKGCERPEVTVEDAHGPRSRVKFGPCGRHLAELRDDGSLRLWDATATTMIVELLAPRGEGAVRAVAFDAEETRIWAACADSRITSWDLATRDNTRDWPVQMNPKLLVSAAAFSISSGLVALGDSTGTVVVHDANGAVVTRIGTPTGRKVQALAWSPDGRRLAVGTDDGIVQVYRRNGLPIYRVSISAYGIGHLTFSPDGRWFTSHFRNNAMQVRDSATGQLVLTGSLPIWGFAQDGKTYAAGSTNEIAFGELLPPQGIDRYQGHLAAVEQLAWAPEGQRFATLSSDFEVRTWDTTRAGLAVAVFPVPPSAGFWATQSAMALGPKGRQIAYASGGRERSRVIVNELATAKEVASWDLPGGFEKLCPMNEGQFLSVREEIGEGFRNVTTMRRLLEIGKPCPAGQVIRTPAASDRSRFIDHWLSQDGQHYLWAGPREPANDRRVELYEVHTGRLVWQIMPPTAPNDLAPDCLLSGNLQHLWIRDGNPKTLHYELPPRKPPTSVNDVLYVVSADQRWVLAGSLAENGIPRAAVLRRGLDDEPWIEFPFRDGNAPAGGRYLFSPDGRHLAWGAASGAVTVIDMLELETQVKQFDVEITPQK
ncbi:MAG: protein kinase [Planctomycetes bacterium]|nr:protein kinase [Planctomycetota bacterium]